MDSRQWIFLTVMLLGSSGVYAFGQDICFERSEDNAMSKIVNCIGVDEACRTSHLSVGNEIQCRFAALSDGISGLNGSTIIGGRSLVHSDATYLMAQLIGYSAWQAYEMMIYSEATDQSFYTPFDQNGVQLLSDDDIASCQAYYGKNLNNDCLLVTPPVNGLSRFDANTGGMWLHMQTRYSSDGHVLPSIPFPVDYLSPTYAPYEKLLTDFRAWVFDEKKELCVYGLSEESVSDGVAASCVNGAYNVNSTINFFSFELPKLSIPLVTPLGSFVINETNNTDDSPVYAEDNSLQAYIAPQEVAYAKMGIFVHALADRYSHHMCTDRSYFFQESTGDYEAVFDTLYCAQGSHFLWHAWEQGTAQTDANLDVNFQTMKPALLAVYDQLLAYAQHKNISVHTGVDREVLVDQIVRILSIYDASERLNQMARLMDDYHVLPLPGHGSMANDSIAQWLLLAGAPGASS